ncbi:ferroxidase HEPHL1-like isoform X2 [Hemibagrus wyckioides]|uniref:ferroxidase HEPHL1-like isoform X2 n=1 Tax=Hemibagrus wyckioides TaxID=337641 RepID=UPI00266C7A91|nr:ferroxidase HEPHL1-like isoform X2 [Hemibagrus wyckioides]
MTRAWVFCYVLLTVLGPSKSETRTYYIGIREEYWNYAPSERNLITGHAIMNDEHAKKYLFNCSKQTGIVYKKAVYKQYTDNTFTSEKPKSQWLGFLGPVIRAEVGDDIVVHLKNFASRPYSIHPHGVFYKKASEGAWYPDGTSGKNKSDDAVAPGQTYTYTWKVTEDFAPTESDSTCLTSMYHSHVNSPKDIAAGLIGVLLICKKAGMQGLFEVSSCGSDPAPTLQPGHVRRYFIAAEEILWNYAPSGKNLLTGTQLDEDSDSKEFFSTDDGKLGGKYWKVRYTGYRDDTFTSRINQSGSEDHLGILGPAIWGEAGDVIEVTFLNKASRNFGIQPHGVSYDKSYEGVIYQDGFQKAGASVAPGQKFKYQWRVTEGPSDSDPPCLSYLYYSATNPVRDTNSGLVGPLKVCKKGALDESGRQDIGSEVLKEFFLLFTVMDENKSWYLQKNIDTFGSDESMTHDALFQESNKMHSVNGFMYGNLPDLYLCHGDHVVWHLLGQGSVDLFAIYFQGNTFKLDNTTHDTLSLFPHSSVTISMIPDNDGLFELNCLIPHHYQGGMRQFYDVKLCTPSQIPGSETTTFKPDVYFYIAAEEVDWNYAPTRTWELEKFNTTLSKSPGSLYLNKSENLIGPIYKKVVYRKYTDETFTKQEDRGSNEEHLGILGPILRVEVGEKVQIVFKNKASRMYSLHAQGVKSSKAQPVTPGNIARYNWIITSGPGPTESNCTIYPYYSSVNFLKDLASGLVGPLVVCRKGTLNSKRQRKDVKKEFALLFMMFDENESWYLDENIDTYMDKKFNDTTEGRFMESNQMHGINGRLYANLHGLKMHQGDWTEWYLMGLGSEEDVHTVHFHHQSFIYKTDYSHRADVYALFPGTFKTVQLRAETPGTWLLHCHVSDHIDSGMETTFTIEARAQSSKAWNNGIVFLQWFCSGLAILLTYWLQ